MRSIRKKYSSERTPKKPITKELLRLMMQRLFATENGRLGMLAPLPMWRTIWRVAMEFFTLGRFDDLIRLRTSSLTFCSQPSEHLKVRFVGGKTDLFSEGSERIVAADLDQPQFCPVRLTRLYLNRLGESYEGLLIPRTRLSPNRELRADPEIPLSYTTALEDLKALLTSLGLDATSYGEHSGKRGGATAAAASGMDVATLQRFGGWRSQSVPSKYVDVDVQTRLNLSKALHL